MKYVLYDWFGINNWLFEAINGLGGSGYDSAMMLFASLSQHESMKIYMVLITLVLFGRLGLLKLHGAEITKQHLKTPGAMLITLVMGYVVYGLITGIMKLLLPMARPYTYYYHRAGEYHYAGYYPEQVDFYTSFPSAAAVTMAFLVVVLWPKLTHPIARGALVFYAFFTCFAQVAVGMHFPADMMYGALLGAWIGRNIHSYVHRMMRVKPQLVRVGAEGAARGKKNTKMLMRVDESERAQLEAQIRAQVTSEMRAEMQREVAAYFQQQEAKKTAQKPSP